MHFQDLERVKIVLLVEGFGGGRIRFVGKDLQTTVTLRGVVPHIAVRANVMICQQIPNGVSMLAVFTISQGPGVGVGVDRDHAVAAQRGEGRAHSFRGSCFSHPALRETNAILYTPREGWLMRLTNSRYSSSACD